MMVLEKKFTTQLKTLEETYSTLKNNLTIASQTTQNNNQPISNVEKVSKTTSNNEEIDRKNQERQKRKEEDAKRKEFEQQQLLQKNQRPEVHEILQIQQQTINTFHQGVKINQETISVADQVCKKLADQTEQMIAIQKSLDELGDGIGRAKKEVGVAMRGIFCDKIGLAIVIILILLVCAAILAQIIYSAVKGKGNLWFATQRSNAFSNGISFFIVLLSLFLLIN